MAQAKLSFKQNGRAFPKAGTTEYASVKTQVVNLLVQQSERAQRADSLGIKITDKQVSNRLDQIKKQYFGGSQKKYLAQLKKQQLTEAQVRESIKGQLIADALEANVTKPITVSDGEVHDYYLQHSQDYAKPQSRDVRYILVKSKQTRGFALRAAQERTGQDVVHAREEVLPRPELEGELRQRQLQQGSDGARVRQGALLGAHETGARADPQRAVRVVRDRADLERPPPQRDAREDRRRDDQADDPRPEEDHCRQRLVDQVDEDLLLEDQVPGRLHAEPGSLRCRHDHERDDDRLARAIV